MNVFCRRFCCIVFCCQCGKANPLKSINQDTRLLPKSERTKIILEKNEIHCYGSVPENLRGAVIDISAYTKSFVRKIVCGNNHCLILFNEGVLAGFGGNEEGQLGLELKKFGNYIDEIRVISLQLSQFSKFEVIDIAAGDSYSLVLILSNLKTYLLRFGIMPEDKYKDNPDRVSTVSVLELDYDKMGNIRKIYAFGQRILLLTGNNDLYVGGVDFDLNPMHKFKYLTQFTNPIKGVYLGQEHCLIIDFEGGIYAIGDGTYGELGMENVINCDKTLKINFKFPFPVKRISVGARHSLILLEDGTLYAFGDNSEGQCTGYGARYATPVQVDLVLNDKIVDVYSGYNHNVIILANGEMYSWGDTSGGKLGYTEGNLTQNTPKIIQTLKGKYANYVALGFQMTVVSTSSYENSLVSLAKL